MPSVLTTLGDLLKEHDLSPPSGIHEWIGNHREQVGPQTLAIAARYLSWVNIFLGVS
jgi:hypothetical protein